MAECYGVLYTLHSYMTIVLYNLNDFLSNSNVILKQEHFTLNIDFFNCAQLWFIPNTMQPEKLFLNKQTKY